MGITSMNGNQRIRSCANPSFLKAHIIVPVIMLVLSACISPTKTIDPKYDYGRKSYSLRETLEKAINKITYDEALMTWGEPASVFDGDKIFLATWGSGKSGSAIMPIGNSWFAIPIQSGWKLQLSFNKESRIMVGWKYDKW
jgi:hypothetical protein